MDDVKRRFPVGATVTGRVVMRQPFGVFLDLGPGALALMEIPSLPRMPGTDRADYVELGDRLTGVVYDHRDSNRQMRVIDPARVS